VAASLAADNLAQLCGWAVVDALLARHFLAHGLRAPERVFDTVAPALRPLQAAALLEVAHAALGLVPSSAFVAFVQVGARLLVLLAFADVARPAQTHWAAGLMLAAWAAIEVPRYAFYLAGGERAPFWLVWLRYSLSLLLYPAGIAGEWLTVYNALETVKSGRLLSISVPNRYNLSYDHHIFGLFALFVLYPPASFFMVANMMRARAKALAAREGERGRKAE
jgi:very-long-chain (3R)-3-hydroxyacyl-CoA dehydratase